MIYWQLFYTFFKIGLFGFGGGYAMLSMIQFEVVERFDWLTMAEFTDMVAMSQMTPGPIGINSATYVGYLVSHSVIGSAVATIAVVLPSFLLMMLVLRMLAQWHENPYVNAIMQVLRVLVLGLIVAAALLLVTPENFGAHCADWSSWLFFAITFVAAKWFKVHPIALIVAVGIVGAIVY